MKSLFGYGILLLDCKFSGHFQRRRRDIPPVGVGIARWDHCTENIGVVALGLRKLKPMYRWQDLTVVDCGLEIRTQTLAVTFPSADKRASSTSAGGTMKNLFSYYWYMI